ncbi:hypothetical protein [Corynebacterium spheniscorum]|uniref:Uncharacterized protein n=1 Tax=Corynebacterium spheniscorum TaxID=185761 RepID=A0A1I2TF83_9CORY|nr:hypothetical protein [Corynebacterium spheniscorum]KAA8721179.1 hypothetical protein F4V56_05725 [Corynebacterium spheniscorum]SFG63574.1 hypothetical protein SAMN05660282_01475 [Corynebacterium spheniscorum]
MTRRVLYVDDVVLKMPKASFALEELSAFSEVAEVLVPVTAAQTTPTGFHQELGQADSVYVADAETARLFCAQWKAVREQICWSDYF